MQHGTCPGPIPYLNTLEEEELVHFFIRCSEIGYPHTLAQILALAQQIVDFKGIEKWLLMVGGKNFVRHAELSLRTAVPLSKARSMATDVESMKQYFTILEDALRKN